MTMSESLEGYDHLVRFFEKQADWLGLPRNTGPVLASLYVAKYESDKKLSVDEICDFTHYSRSNVGLILSQLEALGLATGGADFQQSGRGRRRVLFTIDDSGSSLLSLGIRKMVDRLEDLVSQINVLMGIYGDDAPHIIRMLKNFKTDAQKSIVDLKNY